MISLEHDLLYSNGMDAILQHRAFGNLLFCLLALWPLMRALRRAGLAPGWALLLWLNLLLPGLGLAAVAGILCHKAWPKMPPRPVKFVKRSIWGQS